MKPKTIFEEEVKKGLIGQHDGTTTLEYIEEQARLKGWKQGSIQRQFQAIRPFLKKMKAEGLSLATLDRKGVLCLIGFLQDNDWSEDTRPSNWDRFCQLYRWAYKKAGKIWPSDAVELLFGEDRYIYKRDHNKITQKDTFSPEEMKELVTAEPFLEYKAFFGVTYEGGMRIGESLSLLIKDVSRSDLGFDIDIRESKTMKRRVFVEQYFVAVLDRWLKYHPQRNNPDAPLFLNRQGNKLTGFSANKQLKFMVKKLWPSKTKVSIHSLRHSRATELAEIYTEAQMCAFFGWSMGSKMTATYVRKAIVDIRTAQRRANGQEKITPKITGRKCLVCGYNNDLKVDYCAVCQQPIGEQAIITAKRNAEHFEAIKENWIKEIMERMGKTV